MMAQGRAALALPGRSISIIPRPMLEGQTLQFINLKSTKCLPHFNFLKAILKIVKFTILNISMCHYLTFAILMTITVYFICKRCFLGRSHKYEAKG